MKTQNILIADAAFLGGVGLVQMTQEVAAYFFQRGIYAETFGGSPYTIGFFEAHGLAVLLALAFVMQRNTSQRRFWHGLALVVHVLLGGANLLFWQSFVAFDFVTQGVIATALHIVFILANGYALRKVQAS